MDVDMPDLAPKRPWAVVEGMLPLQGQGEPAPVFWSGGRGHGNNKDQDRTVADADMELMSEIPIGALQGFQIETTFSHIASAIQGPSKEPWYILRSFQGTMVYSRFIPRTHGHSKGIAIEDSGYYVSHC